MPEPRDDAPCGTQALALFTALADRLHARGEAPQAVARLRDRLIVCLFAAHAGALDRAVLERALAGIPDACAAMIREIGIFADASDVSLDPDELGLLRAAASLDWSSIEPTILGTLFECGLDPVRRSRLGAHYTDREAISKIIEPVVMTPLRREFAEVQALTGSRNEVAERYQAYLARLRGVRVLDPACGAGHFLYHALVALQDLEKEVLAWGARRLDMPIRPALAFEVVLGIERDTEAAQLARVTLWIAELRRGRRAPALPATIACRDAILELSPTGQPLRPVWPDAEFIVGNPPFLGGKKLRAELGDHYVELLFAAWAGRVPAEADLVSYWHEAAREQIAAGRCRRAALLATQGIRGGANLEVLRRIKASGDIFMAWRDQPWTTQGAAVRVSMVAQDDGSEQQRSLDGVAVAVIHADLTGGVAHTPDVTRARRLRENAGVAFMGDTKGGKFELSPADAASMLRAAPANREVVVPWVNGLDVTRRPRGMHIVDFGVDMPCATAARYTAPFAYVQDRVAPARAVNRRDAYRERWWIHVEPRPALRTAIRPLRRFIATPTVARSRVFVWLTPPTLPDHQLIVVARDDDYCMGVLHSHIHELWSLRMCT
ncbi:MAG TPA: DNA methyltransferase, partial [Nannocystis sp.]